MAVGHFIDERVHEAYWTRDWNCAVTTLWILSDVFDIDLNHQVFAAAVGMNGAGRYRAQCGLVEGALMFIGVLGRARGLGDDTIQQACYNYAVEFEDRFGSLLCRELRPEGFAPDNPPHLCEDLTRRAIRFDVAFASSSVDREEETE